MNLWWIWVEIESEVELEKFFGGMLNIIVHCSHKDLNISKLSKSGEREAEFVFPIKAKVSLKFGIVFINPKFIKREAEVEKAKTFGKLGIPKF